MHSRFWQFDFEDLFVIRGHDKLAFASILIFLLNAFLLWGFRVFALCNKYKLKARNVTWDLFTILLRFCSQRVQSFVTNKLNVQDYFGVFARGCGELKNRHLWGAYVSTAFFFFNFILSPNEVREIITTLMQQNRIVWRLQACRHLEI